jgi:hypothetical protein
LFGSCKNRERQCPKTVGWQKPRGPVPTYLEDEAMPSSLGDRRPVAPNLVPGIAPRSPSDGCAIGLCVSTLEFGAAAARTERNTVRKNPALEFVIVITEFARKNIKMPGSRTKAHPLARGMRMMIRAPKATLEVGAATQQVSSRRGGGLVRPSTVVRSVLAHS